MKKYIFIFIIVTLISFTTLTKNASKNLENKIYNKKEKLILLENQYNLILLEHNYLSTPEKLFSYSDKIRKEDYIPIDITKLNKITFQQNNIEIKKFIEND